MNMKAGGGPISVFEFTPQILVELLAAFVAQFGKILSTSSDDLNEVGV